MTLWGGRFQQRLDPAAWQFNASLAFDQRMAVQDVQGSLAWAGALTQAGVLNPAEGARISNGLWIIELELRNQRFIFQPGDEDIHSAVERRLGELVGEVAGKLHTGRSRNDQVATDFRLWLIGALQQLNEHLAALQEVLIRRGEKDSPLIMPGYTHLQPAQPILLGHWWLATFWQLQRDRQRLAQLKQRSAVLPLGSGALAGTPVPVDRDKLAKELGFDHPSENSLDAVSDRDFVAEFLWCSSMTALHLSRLAESVVLFSSAEFGFFELSDAFSTGSSLMPQKKNPDVFELVRGKAGTMIGILSGFLATLKGLPSIYDKDLQEDKCAVFTAYDTLSASLRVVAGALETLTIHPERMKASLSPSLMTTDLADYLVAKGVPFRQAHHLTGKAVRRSLELNQAIDQLSLAEYQKISPMFDGSLYGVFDAETSIKRRSSSGGTAPDALAAQLEKAKGALEEG
jgi:argininosuccinate lyase